MVRLINWYDVMSVFLRLMLFKLEMDNLIREGREPLDVFLICFEVS